MYEKSGGTNRFHTCSECLNYVQPDRDYNYKTCALHPERPMDWSADHTACRFYCGEKSEEEIKWQQVDGIAKQFLAGEITSAEAVDAAAAMVAQSKGEALFKLARGTGKNEAVLRALKTEIAEPWPSHQMTIEEYLETI